jgi:hypothetical protein
MIIASLYLGNAFELGDESSGFFRQLIEAHGNGQEAVTVRDNIPMRDSQLAKSLASDITPREWFELLNKQALDKPTTMRLTQMMDLTLGSNGID